MKKTDPYKLLRIISLILGIICMLLMLKGKVFAAEMSDQDQEYINNLLNGCDNTQYLEQYITFTYQNFPCFVHLHCDYTDIILFTNNENIASRHYSMIYNDVPDLNFYYVWGFRGSTDRMYITSYDVNYTMADAVSNPYTTNSRNEKIFEVQLVIQNYADITPTVKTASMGCFCMYDDDLANQTFETQLIDFYTGETDVWSREFHYNYFSSSDCKQNWVSSSTGNTYNNPFQQRGTVQGVPVYSGSYNYLNESFQFFTNHTTYIPEGNSLITSNIYGFIDANIDYPDNEFTPTVVNYTAQDYQDALDITTDFYQVFGGNEFTLSTANFDLLHVPAWASKAIIYISPGYSSGYIYVNESIYYDQDNEYYLNLDDHIYTVKYTANNALPTDNNYVESPKELIYDLLNFYDYVHVIYLTWDLDDPAPDAATSRIVSSKIYFSNMYYTRLNIMAENGSQEAIQGQSSLIKAQLTMIYEYLNNLDSNVSKIVGVGTIENNILGVLNDILDALLNLDIDIPEADYSSIISAINGVKSAIENQNSGNIDTDSYTGYKAWLFNIDREDAIVSPHEFAIDSLNTVKGFFDWATTRYYPSAAAEFFQRARDYVTFLNGTNDQYHNYSTGIVNGNYDPHNINGTQYP